MAAASSTMHPFAVVRVCDSATNHHPSVISPKDLFLTMAPSSEDALRSASSWCENVKPNTYDLTDTIVSTRYLSMAGITRAISLTLWGSHPIKYQVARVRLVGDPMAPGARLYVLGWGGTMVPEVAPTVVCCYATTHTQALAILCMSDDPVIGKMLGVVGMVARPSDIWEHPGDPFGAWGEPRHSPLYTYFAAQPAGNLFVAVRRSRSPSNDSPMMATPGPASTKERVMEMV